MSGAYPPLPGPYRVGVVDVALSSDRDDTQAFFRLFYPTEAASGSEPAWLPHWRYCKGYSGFVNSDLLTGPKPKKAGFQRVLQAVSLALLELLVLVLGLLWARLPARPAAPLAPPSVLAPDAEADPRDAAPGAAAAALPFIVLSHGLGGTRTAYGGHACAFASSGRVVCALEHGDATACLATIPARPPAVGARPAKSAWLLYGGCGSGAERWAKVARRCSEATLVLDLLQALAEQKPGAQLPHAPRVTWPERLPPPPLNCPLPATGDPSAAFLEQFRGRVDTDALVAAGHSFGGATAIALARADARIAACVVNDPWLHACAPSDTAATPWRHPVALLVTLCEDWTVSKLHDEAAMARVRDGVRSGGGVAALAGQRGTTHFSFGDTVFFIPHALTRRLRPGFKKDPPPPPGPQAVAAFALMDAFLRRHTGAHRASPDEARARAERVAAAAMKADGDAGEALAWRDDDSHAQMIATTLGDDALVLMS